MNYIIDGTGPDDNAKYNADMQRGFCWKINLQVAASLYLRGPNLSGLTTFQIADVLFETILSDHAANPAEPIVLIGHSRGGSACIYIARKLDQRNIKVRALILFDAVRRAVQVSPAEQLQRVISNSHGVPAAFAALAVVAAAEMALDYFQVGSLDIDVIPKNVEIALHLTRDEKFSNYFINCNEFRELRDKIRGAEQRGVSCDAEKRRVWTLLGFHRNMRDACRFDCIGPLTGLATGFSFSNTGLRAEAGCRLLPIESNKYLATHGAMGGAPIRVSDYISDSYYSAQIEAQEVVSMLAVEARVNGFLSEVGVNGRIRLDYVAASFTANQSQTRIGHGRR